MINIFNQKKYNAQLQVVLIDVDHANLFYMSILLFTIDPQGCRLDVMSFMDPSKREEFSRLFPEQAFHNSNNSLYQIACTNIYKTKDGRFFHLHGSLNNEPTQKMLNISFSMDITGRLECNKIYADAVTQFTSEEIQKLTSDVYGQAETICWSIEE